MKRFSWLNLFFIFLITLLFASIMVAFALRRYVKLVDMLNISLILYILLTFSLLSALISGFLYYGLRYQQRKIVRKLQWLIEGKYDHPLFSINEQQHTGIRLYTDIASDQIDTLSKKLVTLSQDMNRWTQQNNALNGQEKEKVVESERKRIARELHDSVSQQLFATSMLVSTLRYMIDGENEAMTQQLQLIEKTVNEAQNELRALLLHLRPVKLEDKTLKEGIERLLKELDSKIAITVVSDLSPVQLSPETEDHLFRIVQELLSNVLRHAHATKVEVYLQQTDTQVQLRVQDNGIGFDTTVSKMGSYGLTNIKERIAGLGGTVNIVSVVNQGTIVDIRLICLEKPKGVGND